ncbi:spermatogenesis-associated protein 22 [Eleutherodactylus coqui]|uniref:spermatogenesis-associated protein 22 n=1 Tax=Eleutherodactylus coqui TaxID=57060 RepID=UPI0034622178
MKRSFPACLPVPIFNQKKRNRQPLTSVPQIKELTSDGIHFDHESFHFPSLPAESVWENRLPQLQNAAKKLEIRLTDKRTNISSEDENLFNSCSKDLLPGPKRHYGQSVNEKYSSQDPTSAQISNPTSASSYKRSLYSSATSSATKDQQPSYFFKSQAKVNKYNASADMSEVLTQRIPLSQMTFKEKSNSLRIISASIENMKYWSQYSDRIPLLFEVLATLDSAVTSGNHGSKLFLLRDGKNHLQCTFYEIDRDLPRLIRGRIHRAMGSYDQKRSLFKCVSVRPASGAEQQTFMEYVIAADKEMQKSAAALGDTK